MNINNTSSPFGASGGMGAGSPVTVAQVQHKITSVEKRMVVESESGDHPVKKLQVTQQLQAEMVALRLQVQRLEEALMQQGKAGPTLPIPGTDVSQPAVEKPPFRAMA